jgi:hypothetical protein
MNNLDQDVGYVELGTSSIYLGATDQLRRIAARILTGGELLAFPSPCGSNCTYNISFVGPAYDCVQFDPLSTLPNFTDPQLNTPWTENPYPNPTQIDIPFYFYAIELLGNASTQGLWIVNGDPAENYTIHCTLHNATYNTNVNFTSNLAVLTTDVVPHEQLNTSQVYLGYSLMEEAIETNATNASLIECQTWSLLNLFSINEAIVQLLTGIVELESAAGGFVETGTSIGISSFVDTSPFNFSLPFTIMPRILEELLVNTTLSFTAFLQRPAIHQISPNAEQPVIYTSVPATVITYPPRYSYNRTVLWEAYATAIGVSAICILIGAYMLWDNGIAADMSFAQVLVTTRNRTLDKVCAGANLGGELISDELKETQLRFGMLQSGEQPHPCFGLESEIVPLKGKGATMFRQ